MIRDRERTAHVQRRRGRGDGAPPRGPEDQRDAQEKDDDDDEGSPHVGDGSITGKQNRLLETVAESKADVFDGIHFFVPTALYAGWAHRLRGDGEQARASFEAGLTLLDSVIQQRPEDWRVHAARGLTLAALGRRAEALAEARWIERSSVYSRDALAGPAAAEARAAILAQAGEVEAAIDQIEPLLKEPSWLSVHVLRLDPVWDPLRPHSRCEKTMYPLPLPNQPRETARASLQRRSGAVTS